MHDIKIASAEETGAVQDFIRRYWKEDHIFVTSKEMLLWQHSSSDTPHALNFVIAKDKGSGTVDAINGFISTSHFDSDLESCRDFWLAIWKRREDISDVTLGIRLFYFVQQTFVPRSIGVVGLSEVAATLYARLGFQVGHLNQYFILNRNIASPTIAVDKGFEFSELHAPSPYTITEVSGSDMRAMKKITPGKWVPTKSIRFLLNRYVRHPVYKYRVFAVLEAGVPRCLIVMRAAHAQGSSCLRIVDFYGAFEGLASIQSELLTLAEREHAEYVDCYNYGVEPEVFRRLGFERRNDRVTIPNYFEPFERRNIDLTFGIKSDCRYVVFKGDSDQDRPNVLPKS